MNWRTRFDPFAFACRRAEVKDAARLGAFVVGYTLNVGLQLQDIGTAGHKVRNCENYRKLIVGSCQRGLVIKAKGGQDSLYAVDYAARVVCKIGADVVKLNVPTSEVAAAASPRAEFI